MHRDLKPNNVIIGKHPATGNEIARLIDFGIAKTVLPENELAGLTKSGELVGSPAYISPEQCRAVPIDKRTDIYSLGCLLFECVKGAPPFRASSSLETLVQHMKMHRRLR